MKVSPKAFEPHELPLDQCKVTGKAQVTTDNGGLVWALIVVISGELRLVYFDRADNTFRLLDFPPLSE